MVLLHLVYNFFWFIFKHFWFAAIIVTGINWLILKKRAQKRIAKNQDLEKGYQDLLRGFIIWMNIPWIVMGIGCTVGGVPSVWHYFRPRDGNPFVLAWFGSVFFLWIAFTFWLFFRGGAEMLARHPGFLSFRFGIKSKEITHPIIIKGFWLLCLAGGLVGVVAIWTLDIPLPDFRSLFNYLIGTQE